MRDFGAKTGDFFEKCLLPNFFKIKPACQAGFRAFREIGAYFAYFNVIFLRLSVNSDACFYVKNLKNITNKPLKYPTKP